MDRGRMGRASNRLSEMPMRVVDTNRMSMVNATPQSSFGKLNIPKPQSVTSEKRTSFFGGRTSGAGLPRTSMFGGVEKVKDTRPLHDKAYVQQCISQLCEFLTDKGFPGTVTNKSLQSPSTKEFLKMFEFIYTQLDPSFQMPTSKVEEEVPRILKDLGYPLVLSKSSMFSVGAPHTWPQVLGALIWLIDTVKIYYSMMDQDDQLFHDLSEEGLEVEERAEYKKLFLDYTAETYAKFMQGADEFYEEDQVYLTKLKKLYNVDEGHLASVEEKYEALKKEVERLEAESQTDRLMPKRNEKVRLQTDLQKLQNYCEEMVTFRAGLLSKNAALTSELESIAAQVEALKLEQTVLQEQLQKQKFTPADIERINREKKELQQTIARLGASQEEAEQLVWKEEMNLSTVREKVDLKLAEYHKLARKLKLIPQTAENACGRDFEIKNTSHFTATSMVQHRTQLQMTLNKLISDVEEENSQLTNSKLNLEESIEQVNSNIAEKTNDLKQLKDQIRKLDEQLEQDSQEMALEEEKWATEVDSVESHLKLIEKNVMQGYEEAVEQQKAAQQQYHLVVQETSERRRRIANNLTSICSAAADHLTAVEKFFEDQRAKVRRVCARGMEEDQVKMRKLRELVDSFTSRAKDL